MPKKCLLHSDRFCFVCGKFTSKEQQRNITYDIKKMCLELRVCLEITTCHAFKWIFSNFRENFKSLSYQKGVAELLAANKEMGRRMSLKMRFFHSHLEFSPENLGAVSDKKGEKIFKQ